MSILRKTLVTMLLSLLISAFTSLAFAQMPPAGGGGGQPPSGGSGGGSAQPPSGGFPPSGGGGGSPSSPPGGFNPSDLDKIDFDDFDVAGFLNQFDPSTFSSFGAKDLDRLTPELTKGLDMSYIQNLNPEVVGALNLDFFQNLKPSAFAGFTPDQISQLSGSQWSALDHDQLGELSPDAIRAMGDDVLRNINPTEFRAMPSENISKMMVNFDSKTFSADEVKDFLPEGWAVDNGTGRLTPPPGATVALRELTMTPFNNLTMPSMPDLGSGLAIGGNTSAGTVLLGLNQALESAVGQNYSFEQDTAGILKVRNGPGAGVAAAFMVESKSMKQAMPGTQSGIGLDDAGKYVLTTPDGLQVPVIPSLQNPEALLNAITGMNIKIEEEGDTRIEIPGELPIMCIPDPYVQPSSDLPVGAHRNGDGPDAQVIMVYPDGSSQLLNPMIQDRDSFTNTVREIPQIRSMQIRVDGSIVVDYEGQNLRLRPAFDITPGNGTSTQPSIQLLSPNTAEFINAQGDRQVFYIQ